MLKPRGFHILPDKERRQWQNPEAILAEIGLNQGMTFLDIGCGQGFFAIPAAKIVGVNGKVYGLDINPDNIEALKQKSLHEGLSNLVLQTGEAEKVILCDACADIIFFGIVLHDFKNASKVLANARKMIKSTGWLVNLDWKKEETPFGPPEHIRFDQEESKHLIESQGFKIKSITDSGLYHYLIIAKP